VGVRVAIIDTGLLARPLPPSLQHDISLGPNAIEDPDFDKDSYIDPVAGHGTFIAGIIRDLAPAAELTIEQMIDQAGVISELDLADRLMSALAKRPHLINLSLGGYTDLNHEPLALRTVWSEIQSQEPPIVVVAAAGNSASNVPFWPAASAFAVGVGAQGVDGTQAWFSNFGEWVDAWAPGEDLQGAYAAGDYLLHITPRWRRFVPPTPMRGVLRRFTGNLSRTMLPVRHFEGVARWSGTSFATPVVVGVIAALMSEQHLTAPEARDRVLAQPMNVLELCGT
jgi:subtilisin family serine protease